MEKFSKKYEKSLDLFSDLSYNYELLMMMGDFAPFFRKRQFSRRKKGRKNRLLSILAARCRKKFLGVIVNLWSQLKWLNLSNWVITLV